MIQDLKTRISKRKTQIEQQIRNIQDSKLKIYSNIILLLNF